MKLLTNKKVNDLKLLSDKLRMHEEAENSAKVNANDNRIKYHYAPLDTVFKILETDSIRLSNSRFSNDESEEKMLGDSWTKNKSYRADNYIFCVCDDGDRLSQWRGYCPDGGASIGLSVDFTSDYSILFANSKIENISSVNRAIPVIYASIKENSETIVRIKNAINELELDIDMADTVPYIKNDNFYEEKESRIVFSNIDNDYDRCVRFREVANKIQVPYILVKFGHTEKDLVPAAFDFSDSAVEKFIKERENPVEIYIPQGNNQEKIYNVVKKKYKELRKKAPRANPKMYIYCEGHLPVKKIYVSPTYDRERTVESIKRFCKSRYWLSEVEVVASEIPFIPPTR